METVTQDKIDVVFFLLQVFCTFALTGIIWFMQIVHYPLMRKVGKGRFVVYARAHLMLATFIIAPLMLLEATAVFYGLISQTHWIADEASRLGAVLLLIIWIITFALHLPQQRKLEREFEARAYRRMLFGNWVRCYGWSFRSIILVFSMLQAFIG
ncbi:MAG: hypothetical protein KFH87_05240 [Bacteroidetes bacterium]|nr:hypothetical protein [Bacteroidota bacterium]